MTLLEKIAAEARDDRLCPCCGAERKHTWTVVDNDDRPWAARQYRRDFVCASCEPEREVNPWTRSEEVRLRDHAAAVTDDKRAMA